MSHGRAGARRDRKGARWGALVGAAALALTACARVDADLTLNPEDTVSGTVTVAVLDEWVELVGEEPSDSPSIGFGLEDIASSSERYAQDGFTGRTFRLEEAPFDDFSPLGSLAFFREGDRYRVTSEPIDLAGGADVYDQREKAILDAMGGSIAITFPGPVSKANGDIDGNTVTWDLRNGDEITPMAVGSAIPSEDSGIGGVPAWVWIAGGGGFLLLVAALVAIGVVRHKRRAAAGPDLGRTYPPPPPAPPGTYLGAT